MPYYSIFQQLFQFIPRYRFDKKAEATSGNRCRKHFSAWRQFLTCRYVLMMNCDLMEVLRWDRKTILKHPDRNRPPQMEFFRRFPMLKFLPDSSDGASAIPPDAVFDRLRSG